MRSNQKIFVYNKKLPFLSLPILLVLCFIILLIIALLGIVFGVVIGALAIGALIFHKLSKPVNSKKGRLGVDGKTITLEKDEYKVLGKKNS